MFGLHTFENTLTSIENAVKRIKYTGNDIVFIFVYD